MTLEERVAQLEIQMTKLLTARPLAPGAVNKASVTGKIHPSTKRAMERHAPEPSPETLDKWKKQFPKGTRTSRDDFALRLQVHGTRDQVRDIAKRRLFWLKNKGVIFFDEGKFEYYRPVATSEAVKHE